jgi:hypothetical protein
MGVGGSGREVVRPESPTGINRAAEEDIFVGRRRDVFSS